MARPFSWGRECRSQRYSIILRGDSIDDFLAGFPNVSRDQVIARLEQFKERLLQPA